MMEETVLTDDSMDEQYDRPKTRWGPVGAVASPPASVGSMEERYYINILQQKMGFIYPLMYSAFAIELSDLSKPFKFARLKGFERLENCLTKGTYERFLKGETTL